MKQPKINIYAFASLFLVLIIDTMGFGIIMPILPSLFHNLQIGMLPQGFSTHTRDFFFGLTMSIFFIFTFLGSFFMGDLSDQLGRKKVMLICLFSVSIGYLISAASILLKSVTLLMLGRAISGLAAGSQPIGQAAIIDMSTEKNKTLNIGLITLASSIGFIIGPILGGYFSSSFSKGLWGYSLPFFIAALLAIINAISLQVAFKETYVPSHKHKLSILKALTSFKTAFTLQQLHYLSFIYVLIQFGWSVYFQYTSLYLADVFHYSPNKIGLFMAYLGLLFSLSLSLIIRVVLGMMKLYHMLILSLFLVILGILFTLIFKSELSTWLSVIPISVGIALSYAAITSVFSGRVDKDSQGKVMGIIGALGSLAWVMGGLSMGALTLFGTNIPFVVIGVVILWSIFLIIIDAKKYNY